MSTRIFNDIEGEERDREDEAMTRAWTSTDDGIWNQALEDSRRQWTKSWILEGKRANLEKDSGAETTRSWLKEKERWGAQMKRTSGDRWAKQEMSSWNLWKRDWTREKAQVDWVCEMKTTWAKGEGKSWKVKTILRANRANLKTTISWPWEEKVRDGTLDSKAFEGNGDCSEGKRKESYWEVY